MKQMSISKLIGIYLSIVAVFFLVGILFWVFVIKTAFNVGTSVVKEYNKPDTVITTSINGKDTSRVITVKKK